MLGLKTKIVTVVVILANVLGNYALTLGMRQHGEMGVSAREYLLAIFNPWVSVGIVLLILWMLSRMALLSWADLSYVLPMTALGYVLNALMGIYFLGEKVSVARWAGTVLIVAGIVLVGGTAIRTTGPGESA